MAQPLPHKVCGAIHRIESLAQWTRILGWDNLLRGKFSKQWRNLQNYYDAKRKNDNRVATARSNAKLTPAQRKQQQKKKHKQNVFQRIISSLFEAASDMWKHRNSDRHRRENGNDVSVESKFDRKIKQLYGKKSLVMNDNVETYFDLDLNERLRGSLKSKRDWLIRWEHSIHASIKRAIRNVKKSHDPIWTYLDRDKAPRFFVRRHKALTNSRNEARKKKKFRDSKLHSSVGYETKPLKRSTSRVPSPKQPPAYKKDLPTVRSFFKATRRQAKRRARRKEKRITRKIDDRFGDGWHK